MKVILCKDSHYEIFLNQFEKKEEKIEDYFKKLFQKLERYYHIELKGFYEITVYEDSFYGMILDLQKEDVDYYDFLCKEVDMRIHIKEDSVFLYQVEDPFLLSFLKEKGKFYFYKSHYYFEVKDFLTPKEMAYLLECSRIQFQDTKKIKRNGKVCDFSIESMI